MLMLRWMDGFEHYGEIERTTEGIGGGAAWSEIEADGWELSSANPATGDYHLRMPDVDLGSDPLTLPIRRVWGVSKQVVGAGYRFMVENLPSSEGADNDPAIVLADIRDEANQPHFMLVLGTDGSIFAQRAAKFNRVRTAALAAR
jgi:hypothetical protein